MPEDRQRARRLLEVLPPCMRYLRGEMRAAARSELTVPQFRILAHVSAGTAKASDLAEIQGVSVPAMSRMVDGLVRRGFLKRGAHPGDRRQVALGLTAKGADLFDRVKSQVQKRLADRLKALEAGQKRALEDGLAVLEELFP